MKASLGGGFDHESPRARLGVLTDDMVEFSAQDGRFRLDVAGRPDSGAGTTSEFVRAHTLYTATRVSKGAARQIGCAPIEPIVGVFVRTANDGDRVSGRFEVEFLDCSDYLSGEPIDVPGLPMTVSGVYEDLPLDDGSADSAATEPEASPVARRRQDLDRRVRAAEVAAVTA